LADRFYDALMAHAVTEGGCWPILENTPHHRNYPHVWDLLSRDVLATWRPEYPLYEDKLPSEAVAEVPA
jgi:hypothetical protein